MSNDMLILSWNVAGFSSTVHRIYDNYPSLDAYWARHGADIVCLQEHKIPRSHLIHRSDPKKCSHLDGYESFWSCCVDDRRKGFNGVVTFARKGTVRAAHATPLCSPELDNQGRCVMTDHGSFVLFNVYVPASGGHPLSYKMKFLNALRRAMKQQRDIHKKAVILAGDLNIALGPMDIFWNDRVVYITEILEEVAITEDRDKIPRWKLEVAEHWPLIEKVLRSKEVVSTQTTNPTTKEKYQKYRMTVTVNDKKVHLGSHEASPEYCEHSYDFSHWSYFDEDENQHILAQEANVVRLCLLTELMTKIAGVQWDEKIVRSIAETDATVERVSPTRKWLKKVIEEDGMIDSFRHYYPKAEARFTCWHQFTNRRYVNDGSRIDYILVDKSLADHMKQGDEQSLRCCQASNDPSFALTEEAALAAATANGRFQPAAFEGGGIQEGTQDDLDTQFGPLHTGMVYTPPTFSDHIAISVLMDDCILSKDLELEEKDSATRKSQPHKQQKTIASFFKAGSIPDGTEPTSSTSPSFSQQSIVKSTSLSSPTVKKDKSRSGPPRAGIKRSKSAPANSKGTLLHHFKKSS